MPSMITALCALLSATLPALTAAQTVFAHVIVGNTFSYNQAQWESDIQLASSYGIDAFALNIAQPFSGDTATQMVRLIGVESRASWTTNGQGRGRYRHWPSWRTLPAGVQKRRTC